VPAAVHDAYKAAVQAILPEATAGEVYAAARQKSKLMKKAAAK